MNEFVAYYFFTSSFLSALSPDQVWARDKLSIQICHLEGAYVLWDFSICVTATLRYLSNINVPIWLLGMMLINVISCFVPGSQELNGHFYWTTLYKCMLVLKMTKYGSWLHLRTEISWRKYRKCIYSPKTTSAWIEYHKVISKSFPMNVPQPLIAHLCLCQLRYLHVASGTTGPPGSEAACRRPAHQTAPFWWRHVDRETTFS
jgi:hypothetical protein